MMRANGFTRNRATRRAACPLAYGGSANATSYCPECSCSANLRASTRWTTVRSSTLRSVMLALSDDNASRWISTKSALTAARERFETERTRAREQVEHPRAAQWALEDGEPCLAHAVSGGPDRVPRGRLQTTTLELAGDYPDHRLPSSPPFRFSRAGRRRRGPVARRTPAPDCQDRTARGSGSASPARRSRGPKAAPSRPAGRAPGRRGPEARPRRRETQHGM